MITLKNKRLELAFTEKGAELQRITDLATGREYLWQGDGAYWSGRSPILFPAVGGLWNATYRYGGREYPLRKHGFVRDMEWEAVEVADGEEQAVATFRIDLPEGAEGYPFPCRVTVTYRLEGRRLAVRFRVDDCGDREMFFQIGGHPAFNLPDWSADRPVGGYIRLEGPGADGATVLRAGEQGCTGPERYPAPLGPDGLVPVCRETFLNEALIFDGRQLTGATLLDRERRPVVRVGSDAPVWLFWQPQGLYSPFVCAEPWFGLCDRQGFDGDVSERPYILRVEAGGHGEGLLWSADFF